MPLRFRKSIKLFPGVKLNISRSGVSTTLGPRGASVNIGKRGTRATVGIPGTGISYSEQLAPPPKAAGRASSGSRFGLLFLVLMVLALVAWAARH